jgi:hypothetical protein
MIGAGLGVLVLLAMVQFARAVRERPRRRWRELAEGLGGRYLPVREGFWRETHRIVGAGASPALLLERHPAGDDRTVTRLVHDAPDLRGARLVVAREHDPLGLVRGAGLGRVTTGDPVFDEHFVTFADAPARARLWLGLEERRALRVLYGFRLVVEGGRIILEHDEDLPALAQVQAAHAAARLLAGAEARFCERWSEVAPFVDARRASHAPPRLETVRGGVVVSIAPCLDGPEAFVRVRAELARAGAPERQVAGAEPDRDALSDAIAEVAARAQALAAEGPYR